MFQYHKTVIGSYLHFSLCIDNIQYGKRLFEHACSYFVLLVQILDFFSILGVEQTSKEI